MGMPWTDEQIEMLRRLWDDGLSASQIAAEFGAGCTRNAVIGKVHRLGFPPRGSAATVARRLNEAEGVKKYRGSSVRIQRRTNNVAGINIERKRRKQPEFKAEPYIPVEEIEIPFGQRRTLLELNESTCRWPVGDPQTSDFYFCGAQPAANFPYCKAHCRVAYRPPSERGEASKPGFIERTAKQMAKARFKVEAEAA